MPEEQLLRTGHGLVATATRKHKSVNQDACQTIGGPGCDVRAVIVADGIGSDIGSENASEEIVRHLAGQINERAGYSSDWADTHVMRSLFQSAHERLIAVRDMRVAEKGEEVRQRYSGGSTALCIVEQPESIVAAYSGNGGLLQVRADFNEFPGYLLPWSTVNLLNPHSMYSARGIKVDLLYRYLSADASSRQADPTVLTISKDRNGAGDIFVACTDGLYSADEADVTTIEDGAWVRTAPAILLLYKHLDIFFSTTKMTFESLAATLTDFLDEVVSSEMADDDCTIGVLITSRALEYQTERAARKVAKQ